MTPIRLTVLALAIGVLAFDLVRHGSEEYAYKSEISRVQREIALLELVRDDLQVGLQQRLLGLLPRTGVTSRTTIPDLTLDRTPTLWEAMEEREEPRQQAFAAEEVPSTSIPLSDWIRRTE